MSNTIINDNDYTINLISELALIFPISHNEEIIEPLILSNENSISNDLIDQLEEIDGSVDKNIRISIDNSGIVASSSSSSSS